MSSSNKQRSGEQRDSLWMTVQSLPGSKSHINPVVVAAPTAQVYYYNGAELPPPIVVNATSGMMVGERIQGISPSSEEEGAKIAPQHDDTYAVGVAEVAPNNASDRDVPIAAAAAAIPPSMMRATDNDVAFYRNKTTTSESNIVLQKYDVLFGRGKTHRKNPGNVRMQLLADIHREAYMTTTDREDKTYITRGIVNIIKSSGRNRGRFLKFDVVRNCWLEVSDEVARMKIGHALRDGRGRSVGPIHPKDLQEILPLLSDPFKEAALRMGSSDFDN